MNEAPKKIYLNNWIDKWYVDKRKEGDTAYIRADIVDGLRADKAMTGTCELCDMRDPLAEILEALEKLSTHNGEVNTHISAAENHLETADFLLEGHSCDVPKWDGPDTVREART